MRVGRLGCAACTTEWHARLGSRCSSCEREALGAHASAHAATRDDGCGQAIYRERGEEKKNFVFFFFV
jgi:formate dehydrogenase maturation protein FdhE